VILQASQENLELDEKIDSCKLSTLKTDREEAALREELRENQIALTAASNMERDLSTKTREVEQDLETMAHDLEAMKLTHGAHVEGLRAASEVTWHGGHDKLANDMGKLQTLTMVLPQLEEDLVEVRTAPPYRTKSGLHGRT
jgi:hypothetical protein